MVIDSHMHINSLFLENSNFYIDKINDNDSIFSVVNVGIDLTTSKESIAIATNQSKFYSTIGIHPLYIKGQDLNELYSLSENNKVLAIGEIGLDTTNNNIEEQKKYFTYQIFIANELHLPVVIHANNTNSLIIQIFKNTIKPKYGCVFHCFQPDLEILSYLIGQGYYISFAGKVTYKNAKKSLEVVKTVPNELFLVETDSPYISPEPLRNHINESSYIHYIVEKLSEVKDLSVEDIEKMTVENTKRLFKKL